MQETKTLVASIAITAGIIIGVVFWGRDYDKEKTSMVVLSFAEADAEAEELSFITMVVLSASFELILFVLIFSMLMLIGGIFSTCLPLLSSTPS